MCVLSILREEGVVRVTGDQCQYGQSSGQCDPIRKRAGWMTNASCLAGSLSKMRSGKEGRCSRRLGEYHASAFGRAARGAAVPDAVVQSHIPRLQQPAS